MQGNKITKNACSVDEKSTISSTCTLGFGGASNDRGIYTNERDEKSIHQDNNSFRNVGTYSTLNLSTTVLRPTVTMTNMTLSNLLHKLSDYTDALISFYFHHPDHGHMDICLLFSSDIKHIDIELCVSPLASPSLNDTCGKPACCNDFHPLFRKISYKDSADKLFTFHGVFIGRNFYRKAPTLWSWSVISMATPLLCLPTPFQILNGCLGLRQRT